MSSSLTPTVLNILSFLTILGQVLIIIWVLAFIFKKQSWAGAIKSFFGRNAVFFALIVATIATAGSLFLSEIAKIPPCRLCWFQRIFMYPQVILYFIALSKRDKGIAPYGMALSLIGVIFAAYHIFLQNFASVLSSAPCSQLSDVSCSAKGPTYLGYITVPLMSLTAFILIIAVLFLMKKYLRQSSYDKQ
ncbi:MAG: disulfide bond formation protein B [Candidatus Kerfeldbacteria bacterium CG_4_10_14_0_8_um_filter_42_10]|uniref:Disulfide bond formation protein B n=1 Tax=Candidatus Kerfeldbacteria bacterium CG_4_10_14_0_8_um_filter_42_10 TaxID=2014248 RepID=A0A2M7RK10_9BACT|nr:MAG: disulfide bond formation protein B [Candidatus Kerfeldbacteria bacterium CG_4_10_14_0_8_um_filter_42_10]